MLMYFKWIEFSNRNSNIRNNRNVLAEAIIDV